MRRLFRDNGLTLVLVLFFFLSIAGQSLTGFFHHNEERREHGQLALTYVEYITGAAFAESVFENWESEFLQMALYVLLTGLLYQRGSAESKDPDKLEDVDEDPVMHTADPEAPYPVRAGGWLLKIYKYSLSLALSLLFVIAFVLHLVASARADCQQQTLHGQACTSVLAHLAGATFWFESFQNWQSEFLSIGVVVVLSIYLRQKGSPESKPVHASHVSTGR